jgi:hypothetical protein
MQNTKHVGWLHLFIFLRIQKFRLCNSTYRMANMSEDDKDKPNLKPAISGLYIRFHPVYRPCFYFTRKQMTPFYWQQKLADNREYIKTKWHVCYIGNRHISVSSFVYKYDQWPHNSYMTGRAGVWEADDIVKFYRALLDFFPAAL